MIKFESMLSEFADLEAQAELKTQVARAHGLQRDFDTAHRLLDEVEVQLADLSERTMGWYHIERGRVFNSSGDKDKARVQFLEAFALARNAGDEFLAVDAAHMLGIVEPGEQGLHWNERAIEMAKHSEDDLTRNWLASLYNNTAWTYHEMGSYDRAMELFQEALDFRLEQGNPESIQIARWSIARCLRSLGRIEEALAAQHELAAAGGDAYVDEEIAECLILLGRLDEARPYFARAYEQLSKDDWLKEKEPERLSRMAEHAGLQTA